jgi:hypothetical protein
MCYCDFDCFKEEKRGDKAYHLQPGPFEETVGRQGVKAVLALVTQNQELGKRINDGDGNGGRL